MDMKAEVDNIPGLVYVFLFAFVMAAVCGLIYIPVLKKLHFGQTIREDGPSTHLSKSGTPIMGGLIFLTPLIILSVFTGLSNRKVWPLMIAAVAYAAIGFIDDYIKAVRKNKDGLKAGQKMIMLFAVSAAFITYSAYFTDTGTDVYLPFLGAGATFDLKWAYIPVMLLIFLFMTNAVNLTDGVDGLAAGTTVITAMFLAAIAAITGRYDNVRIFAVIIAGGCLGFLIYNLHPARVFMGDTGSLALGGSLCAAALVMKMPVVLLVAGGVYVAEALSVILQVAYYKRTRKRIFKMAPLHHHFELSGWKEGKVVTVFWAATALFCIAALLSMRIL